MGTELSTFEPAILVPVATGPTDDDDLMIAKWLHGRPPSTIKNYKRAIIRFHYAIGWKPLPDVTLIDLQAHADRLKADGLKDATRALNMRAIKSLFRCAAETGYLVFNVARVLQPVRVADDLTQRILPEATITRVLDAEPRPVRRFLLRLLYATGGRVSEVVGLRWENCPATAAGGQCDFLRTKGNKSRSVHVAAPVWAEMQQRRAQAGGVGYVFASTRVTDQPINPATAWKWAVAAGKRVGVRLSPHWFRHAHASHSLDHGAPVHLVMRTLGHASLTTTSRYSHARPGESSGDYLDLGEPGSGDPGS